MDTNDFVTKTGTQKYFIYGYAQTGSGSLTFPEDFDFVGIVDDEDVARDLVKKMNQEICSEEGIYLEGDPEDEDQEAYEDEMSDALQDADAYRYEYDKLDVLTKK